MPYRMRSRLKTTHYWGGLITVSGCFIPNKTYMSEPYLISKKRSCISRQ